MRELYIEQLAYIQQRWPAVYKSVSAIQQPEYQVSTFSVKQTTLKLNNIHLTSCYDRQREASVICDGLLVSQPEQVTVYGVGLGDVQRLLLTQTWLKRLQVVVLNPEILFYVLSFESQLDWLKDPRVELISPAHDDDVMFPFVTYPSELELATEGMAMLRDNVLLELNDRHIREQHSSNSPNIKRRLEENRCFVESDPGVEILTAKLKNATWVLGAGPTLEKQLAHIRDAQKCEAIIIAVDAAVITLLNNGIVPDYVVSVDENAYRFFTDIKWTLLSKSKLVYFPRVSSELLESWPGSRYCAYSKAETYRELAEELPKGFLFTAGSVIHPAIDLAVTLGASEVVLAGADFSFPNNKTHSHWDHKQHFMPDENAVDWVFNGKGEKVKTVANLRGYLRDLERYIKLHSETNFYNTSLEGAAIAGTEMWEPKNDRQ